VRRRARGAKTGQNARWAARLHHRARQSPRTRNATRTKGDQVSYHEYHWHGLQLLTGNAYVLAGLAVFTVLFFAALMSVPAEPALLRVLWWGYAG
jgi:hypothetical protein